MNMTLSKNEKVVKEYVIKSKDGSTNNLAITTDRFIKESTIKVDDNTKYNSYQCNITDITAITYGNTEQEKTTSRLPKGQLALLGLIFISAGAILLILEYLLGLVPLIVGVLIIIFAIIPWKLVLKNYDVLLNIHTKYNTIKIDSTENLMYLNYELMSVILNIQKENQAKQHPYLLANIPGATEIQAEPQAETQKIDSLQPIAQKYENSAYVKAADDYAKAAAKEKNEADQKKLHTCTICSTRYRTDVLDNCPECKTPSNICKNCGLFYRKDIEPKCPNCKTASK